ncbi:MAG: hypothetical protein Q8868_10090 [Bacteroidota bacterium]|nr:hypothetical protein [Bacteroidota bacterium]
MKSKDKIKKKDSRRSSRRQYVETIGAAAAAFTIVPRYVMPGNGVMQPSDTMNIAGIGVGGRENRTPDLPVVALSHLSCLKK